jgi:hypothetical protein
MTLVIYLKLLQVILLLFHFYCGNNNNNHQTKKNSYKSYNIKVILSLKQIEVYLIVLVVVCLLTFHQLLLLSSKNSEMKLKKLYGNIIKKYLPFLYFENLFLLIL